MNKELLKAKLRDTKNNPPEGITNPGEGLVQAFEKCGIRVRTNDREQYGDALSIIAAPEFVPPELLEMMAEICVEDAEARGITYEITKDRLLNDIVEDTGITPNNELKELLWLAYLKGLNVTEDTYRRELNVVELELGE
jgi:hypothetical protein